MSKLTHYFDLNVPKVEHHLVSESDALTITAQASAGEGERFLASKNGLSNHVAGFKTGEDKILVPLELIQEVFPSTTLVKGTLPTERFDDDTNFDSIIYNTVGAFRGRVRYVAPDSSNTIVELLVLDGDPAPALAAADIEII